LRAIENRLLRKIFGPKREEVTRWRKLKNQGVHNLYCTLHQMFVGEPTEGKMGGVCSTHVSDTNKYNILMGKQNGNRRDLTTDRRMMIIIIISYGGVD
jgi:hypothetical protein